MKNKILNIFKSVKENIDYKKVFKIVFLLTCIFIVFNSLEHMTYADGILDYGGSQNPFNEIKNGWGQFIQDQYRNNYSLDSENLGAFDILDKTINGVANIVFYLQVILSWLGVSIFNLCFESNITDAFASILNSVSTALHNGIFNKFYMIMFMVSLISVLIYFTKKNYAAVFSHIIVVALIVSLSVMIKSDSSRTFIVETTSFSREIGESIVSALATPSNADTNSDSINTNEIAGNLWSNLVHKPWLILEFDGKFNVNDESNNTEAMSASKKILSESKNSDEREKAVEEMGIKNISYTSRLASSLILFIITIIKLMILIAISVVQVFMQIMGIAIVLIAPFLLLLAIVPFFGGLNLIKWMGEKYLGVQITIVLLSFVIGVLLLIDSVTLTFFMQLGASFPIALMIQSVCWIMAILFRKQLIDNFNKLQRRVNGNIGAGKVLSKTLDKETELVNNAKDKVVDVADNATAPVRKYVKDSAVNMKEAAESKIRYAGKYATGNIGIKASKIVGSTIDKVAAKFDKKDSEINLEENNNGYKQNNNEQVYKTKAVDLDSVRTSKDNIQEAINEKKNEEVEYVNLVELNKNNLDDKLEEVRNEEEAINLSEENGAILESRNSEECKNNLDVNSKNNINDKLEEVRNGEEAINLSEENGTILESSKAEENKNNLDVNSKNNINNKLKEVRNGEDSISLSEEKRVILDKNKERENKTNLDINSSRLDNKVVNGEKLQKESKSINKEKLNKSINKEKKLKENINSRKLNRNIKENKLNRVEILKNKLGVSDKKIKEKEKKLSRELNKIANKKKVK